jgi:hypothetical protein
MVFTELKDLYAFHSNRSELEKFLVKELGIKYKAECVKEINLEKNQVITNLNAYQFTKYVIDCSGPAKLIANHL